MAIIFKSGLCLPLILIQLGVYLTPPAEGSVLHRYKRATNNGDPCDPAVTTSCDVGFECVQSLVCKQYFLVGSLCTHACYDPSACTDNGGAVFAYNGGSLICQCSDVGGAAFYASSCTAYNADPCTGNDCGGHSHCRDGTCECIDHFVPDETSNGCRDVNECFQEILSGSGVCDPFDSVTGSKACNNMDGGFSCECEAGFQLNPGPACTDIDECVDTTKCSGTEGAVCVNHPGHYLCHTTCPEGTIDIYQDGSVCLSETDACLSRTCPTNAFCESDLKDRTTCICSDGYRMEGFECIDILECGIDEKAKDLCNRPGVIKCSDEGGAFVCHCDVGYTNLGSECVDADECLMELQVDGMCYPGNPDTHATDCINFISRFECTCANGFEFISTQGCVDINECVTSPCGENELCVNTDGGYSCQCMGGYEGEPPTTPCTDINECLMESACGSNAICEDLPGSYACACNAGYEYQGIPPVCVDRNECLAQPGICGENTICTNEIGTYSCACADGSTGSGNPLVCQDQNECLVQPSPCGENTVCINEVGTFSCACADGYTGSRTTPLVCQDINECETASPPCGDRGDCVNEPGSHSCTCHSGYQGQNCYDIDECAGTPCGTNAHCHNTDGGSSCHCDEEYGSWPHCGHQQTTECHEDRECNVYATCDFVHPGHYYKCVCRDGYHGDGIYDCHDDNEHGHH